VERAITFDDGATTVLESWGSSGPNVVCVHGITSSRKSWAQLAKRFELAYRIYAYDQRGHGDAAGVHGPMTLERSLCDLAEVVREIGQPIDALIGH
jgi:pimeloyl-ACP methyl ester carboxylesterase